MLFCSDIPVFFRVQTGKGEEEEEEEEEEENGMSGKPRLASSGQIQIQ